MNSNQNRNRSDTAHQIRPQTRPDDRTDGRTRPDDRTEGYRTGYNAVHRYKSKVIA